MKSPKIEFYSKIEKLDGHELKWDGLFYICNYCGLRAYQSVNGYMCYIKEYTCSEYKLRRLIA